jgi:hypothetical protein
VGQVRGYPVCDGFVGATWLVTGPSRLVSMKESAIDSLLIRYAGVKSANDIAEETGLEPEEVLRRTQELLDRVTLTFPQRRAKAIFQLDEITAEMAGRYKRADDENLARLGNTAAGAIGRVLGELRALEKDAKEHEEEQAAAMGRVLATLVDRAMNRAIGELKQRHPEIETGVLSEIVESHLIEIAAEMDGEA